MSADQNDRTLLGVGLMLGFCAVAPLIDVFAKLAAETLPVGQVTSARYVSQTVTLALVLLVLRSGLDFDRRNIAPLFGSALLSLAATYTFIAAIDQMPIADALAIAFVEPFILLVIGHFFLGHVIGIRRTAAAIFGFAGVVLIIQPKFEELGIVAILPLGTALFFALYMLEMRRLSQRIGPIALQFQVALAGTLISVPALALGSGLNWQGFELEWPEGWAWLWVLVIGVASSGSHLLLTFALRVANSSVLAPLHYLEIVSATIFGYLVFSDFPNRLTLIGIAVVVASGLYVIHRERQAKAQLPPPASPTGV